MSSEQDKNTEEISLGSCLHDGILEKLSSDLMARTLTFVIDSPFHWEHHKLSEETRFEIVAEGVRVVEVFNFEPWPGASEPPKGTLYEDAEKHRRREDERGRVESSDWKAFTAEVESDGHTILNATLNKNGAPLKSIRLGILSDRNSDYRDIQIQADDFHFSIGKREMSVEDFQSFGEAYWKAWAARNTNQTTRSESSS
jgi:hypothetical protein